MCVCCVRVSKQLFLETHTHDVTAIFPLTFSVLPCDDNKCLAMSLLYRLLGLIFEQPLHFLMVRRTHTNTRTRTQPTTNLTPEHPPLRRRRPTRPTP